MKIPLHSLVFDFNPENNSGLNFLHVKNEIFGDHELFYTNSDIWDELKHKIYLKLWHGERVIINATGMQKNERDMLSSIAQELDVPIFYLLKKYPEDKDIAKGDNIAQIVVGEYSLIDKFYIPDIYSHIQKNNNGVTIIGDVHGNYESLMNAILWSNSRNNLPVFLGDIIDFGVKSLECVEEVYKLVVRNQALFIIGNHERKIFKWLNKLNNKNIKLHLSEANKQTIEQIKRLSNKEKKKWETKFRTLMNLGFTHLDINNIFCVHASYHADMKNHINNRVLPFDLEKKALFGEFVDDPKWETDVNNTSYKWISSIPKNKTVFVGHEPRNLFKPYYEKNVDGGEVYFMDTGCGKGGNLSSVDVIIQNDVFKVMNFNSW